MNSTKILQKIILQKIFDEVGISFEVHSSFGEWRDSSSLHALLMNDDTIEGLTILSDANVLGKYFSFFNDISYLKLCYEYDFYINSLRRFKKLLWLDISSEEISKLSESIGNLTSLTVLAISGTQIRELPESIGNLISLTELYIDDTQIRELPESIGNLTSLTELYIGDTQIRELPESIGNLASLTGLYIGDTQIKELPESINNLTSLIGLDISNTQIKELPESIGNLTSLIGLDISNTQIRELPESIGNLTSLIRLDISNTQIRELSESIGNLTSLTRLDISNTQIRELPESIGNLTSLTSLDISNTQISELPESISKLTSLEEIDLSKTNIKEVPFFIFSMKNIKVLNLSYNEFELIPKDILNLNLPFYTIKRYFLSGNKNGIYMNELNLKEMDINIFNKSPEHIREYYNELKKEEPVLLNEARVIFIGNADAGKTAIIKRLMTGKYIPDSDSTRGIYINKMVFKVNEDNNNHDINVNFWDFGGQEIMHSMHEFFLGARCLYVVVLDGRRDEEPERWLDLVKQYGKNSPVMVVMNKIDQNNDASIDESKINSDYGDSFSKLCFSSISCKLGTNFDQFKIDFLSMVQETKSYKEIFPGRWNHIKLKLSDMKSEYQKQINYIDEKDFVKYCEEEKITNDSSQGILLDWLNDLGICFSYKSKSFVGAVDGFKVLRPEWITNGIYKIINSEKIKNQNGFLSLNLITDILISEVGENEKYQNTEKDFILGMMHDFDLSYRIGDAEFIPMLMQQSEPKDIPINRTDSICFKIKYEELLPTAVLCQLVVRMRQYVDREYTWRRGVFLQDIIFHQCKALIFFGKTNNELIIYVEGDKNIRYTFLSYIRAQLIDIQKNISLDYKEYIEYRKDNKTANVDFNRLRKLLDKNILKDYIDEFDIEVDVLDILKSFMPVSVIEKLVEPSKTINEINSNVSIIKKIVSDMDKKMDNEIDKRIEFDKKILDLTNQVGKICSSLENVEGFDDKYLIPIKSFLEDNYDAVNQFQSKEILEATNEIIELIRNNNKSSAGKKISSLLSMLSTIVTLGAATNEVINHPEVIIFFQSFVEFIQETWSRIKVC